jgi:hypothetical protein
MARKFRDRVRAAKPQKLEMHCFADVWDALASSPEEAAKWKAESEAQDKAKAELITNSRGFLVKAEAGRVVGPELVKVILAL